MPFDSAGFYVSPWPRARDQQRRDPRRLNGRVSGGAGGNQAKCDLPLRTAGSAQAVRGLRGSTGLREPQRLQWGGRPGGGRRGGALATAMGGGSPPAWALSPCLGGAGGCPNAQGPLTPLLLQLPGYGRTAGSPPQTAIVPSPARLRPSSSSSS